MIISSVRTSSILEKTTSEELGDPCCRNYNLLLLLKVNAMK
jgi:hypothetical protein